MNMYIMPDSWYCHTMVFLSLRFIDVYCCCCCLSALFCLYLCIVARYSLSVLMYCTIMEMNQRVGVNCVSNQLYSLAGPRLVSLPEHVRESGNETKRLSTLRSQFTAVINRDVINFASRDEVVAYGALGPCGADLYTAIYR